MVGPTYKFDGFGYVSDFYTFAFQYLGYASDFYTFVFHYSWLQNSTILLDHDFINLVP
jgi:hypothetical protein